LAQGSFSATSKVPALPFIASGERSYLLFHGYGSADLDFLPPRHPALARDLEQQAELIALMLSRLACLQDGKPLTTPCKIVGAAPERVGTV